MIADNVRRVLDDIQDAARRCGRNSSEITVVAVSKTRTVEEIEQVVAAGIEHLGENRLQEAVSKIPDVQGEAVWHMVGHLQSNKGKKAAELFDWIDSVDSKKIANILSAQAVESDKTLNVLIQANISGELSKSGIKPGDVKELISYVKNKKGLVFRGLMTISSFGVSPEVTRAEFAKMKALFDSLREDNEADSRMDVLSMGMSQDYRIAVEEGSTMVRIGTAIFGLRS